MRPRSTPFAPSSAVVSSKSRNPLLLAFTVTLCLAGAQRAMAQRTWTGGGADANWSTVANWNTGPISGNLGVATFAGETQTTSTNDVSGLIIGGWNFTNDGTTGKTMGFVLSGSALTLGTNSLATTAVSGTPITNTINNDLVFNGDRTFNTSTNHSVTVTGNISETGGTRALIKGGGATLTLSGNNTYTGTTFINNGTLFINSIADSVSGSNIGFGNLLRMGDATTTGTLNYTGSGSSTARSVQIGHQGTSIVAAGGGTTISASGTNGGTGLKFTAAVFNTADVGTIALTTSRTLTLSGTNTDANTIGGEIANVNGATTLTNLSKTGAGRWILGGANTYTGSTTLNAGTLVLNYGTGGSNFSKLSNTASTGTLLLNGGTLELSGGSHAETVLSTTLNTGGTFIKQTNSGTSTLSMGDITFTSGAINFSAGSIATTSTGVTNGILSQRATVAGANFAMKGTSDSIVAYDYLTNGSTGYTGGAMSANTNYELTANGIGTATGTTGAATNTLKIANTAVGSLPVTGTLVTGAILFTGSADYSITTTGSGRMNTSVLHNYGTGGATLTLGVLNAAITQFGTGKTILTQTALNNNALTINGGTVQISNNLQIGTNAANATITLNDGTLLANTAGGDIALNNGSFVRNVTLNAGGGTLDVIGGNKLTVSGVISGTGNPLTIGSASGNGSVVLSGLNTYSGSTSVNGGKLVVTDSIGSSAVTVTNAGSILASDAAATIGSSLVVNNGAILAVGDAGNAATATATVVGATTFNNGSIFSWDINSTGTGYDKLVTTSLVDGNAAGGSVFRIVAGDATFGAPFWQSNQTWTDIFTTNGTAAIANWATLFGNTVSVVNSSFNTITPLAAGTFSIAGNTLTWTAVPEPTSALAGLLLGAGLLRRRRA